MPPTLQQMKFYILCPGKLLFMWRSPSLSQVHTWSLPDALGPSKVLVGTEKLLKFKFVEHLGHVHVCYFTEFSHYTTREIQLLSHVQLLTTPWTVAHQAPLFMEFSKQEYWSGLPFPSLGDLPNPRIESESPEL